MTGEPCKSALNAFFCDFVNHFHTRSVQMGTGIGNEVHVRMKCDIVKPHVEFINWFCISNQC